MTAIECLDRLYKFLVKPFLEQRLTVVTSRKELSIGIAGVKKKCPLDLDQPLQRVEFDVMRRYVLCKITKIRKSKTGCASCKRAACQEHSVVMCNDCAGLYNKIAYLMHILY